MKKIFKTTMAFVAAVSLLSLAGCAKVQKEEINPTYDGEAVKTQFSISMPGQLKSKMTESTVQAQATPVFRGMKNIALIPYKDANTLVRLGANVTLRAKTLAKPQANNEQNAIPAANLLDGSNAVLFNDVTVPLQTSGFVFYGEAAANADGFTYGALHENNLEAAGPATEIFFAPERVLDIDGNGSVVMTVGDALADYVSAIAAVKFTDATDGDVYWYMYADAANNNKDWYNPALGELYTNFTSLKAGASSYVQAAVQDLYSSVFNSANPIAAAIRTAILTKATDNAPADGVLDSWNSTISGYPADNNMPEGTAFLTWATSANGYKEATAATAGNAGQSGYDSNNDGDYNDPGDIAPADVMALDMESVVYPTSLWYYVKSAIKTSNSSQAAVYLNTGDANYANYDTWDEIKGAYENDNASVTASTRSIAIKDPIQYAVGRLDTKVTQLNQDHYYDRNGQEVNIPADGFQLTGILIGGQKRVDYKFDQIASGQPNYVATEYTIYDNVMNTENNGKNYLKANQDAGTNYTLALPTAADQTVYVALEFQNGASNDANATDFQGIDGVVKKGCKFYMIALLDPASGTGSLDQIFQQDYYTTANFTIGAGRADTNMNGIIDEGDDAGTVGGFANAYVTIPDLRTPQLELGFSVDLTWTPGFECNHTF